VTSKRSPARRETNAARTALFGRTQGVTETRTEPGLSAPEGRKMVAQGQGASDSGHSRPPPWAREQMSCPSAPQARPA
jgi:hypothetical protein